MSLDELAKVLSELNGAEASFPFGPEVRAWKVGGKVFAFDSERGGAASVSVKALPENVPALIAGVDGIGPGYHLNKRHWVTVTLDLVPDDLVAELVRESHAIVVAGLPKRLRLTLDGTASGSLNADD